MAENTWEKLQPSGTPPEKKGYTGCSIGGGYIWYWGGGHKAGALNSVDVYNIAENKWERLTTAEDIREVDTWDHLTEEEKQIVKDRWGAGGPTSVLSPLGRPLCNHSYDRHIYWPDTGEYCMIHGVGENNEPALWCYDPLKGDEPGTLASSAYDPTQPDGAWRIETMLPTDRYGGNYHTYGMDYDTNRGAIVVVRNTGREAIWRYDGTSWETVTTSLVKGDNWGEGYIEYIPPLDAYATTRKQLFQLVDATTGATTVVKQPPINQRSFSIEYSPELERLIVADDVDSVPVLFAYDATNDKWDEVHIGGTPPINPQLAQDFLNRDPDTGKWYLIFQEPGGGENLPGEVYAFTLTQDALSEPTTTSCSADACVGPNSKFSSIQNAVDSVDPGGIVALEGGVYTQSVFIDKPLTLTSMSGRAHIKDEIYGTKAPIVVNHDTGTVTLEGIEVSSGGDEKAVWQSNDSSILVLRDVIIHSSGMGVLAGPNAVSTQLYNCELYGMSSSSEKSHFIYGGESKELIVEGCYIHGGTDGHLIKAQSIDVTIRNNQIIQENPTDINLIDVWGCGSALIEGNDIQQANDHIHAIGFTPRGGDTPCPADTHTAIVRNNTYFKNGDRKWTGFVSNRYDPMTLSDFTIENNVVDGAWLYRGEQNILVGDLNGTNTTSNGEDTSDGGTTTEPVGEVAITGGQYHVTVAGEVVSDHNQSKEAIQKALNLILTGETDVRITRDEIRVEVQ